MIRPTGDRVLVALPPREDVTVSAGGIVLVKDPDRFYAPTRGIVVALGEKTGVITVDAAYDAIMENVIVDQDGDDLACHASDVRNALDAIAPAPFDVEVGDCVIFPQSAGQEFTDDGLDYVILREAEIIGIVEPLVSAVA